MHCNIESSLFSAGGPGNLGEMLSIFYRWVKLD
ncbi:immunity 53 family protein [Paenibacillus sp. UKAQ_18]|nr:immunity 53 family protein [Paenibacillus sp. UKAQ_18]WDZ59984.1 immunity 53 family protein [Paenibacillus polymyxa]